MATLAETDDGDSMGLTDKDHKAIADKVVAGLLEQMPSHTCRFDRLDVDTVNDLMHNIKEVGGGKASVGIDVMRENHKFLKRIRAKGNKVGTAIFMAIVIGLAASVGLLIKLGVKSWLASLPKP